MNESVAFKDELLGDCIDCFACVRVCPTGIDIRNGTQLECINCTACMDACDAIMISLNRPTGLIRYASENTIRTGVKLKLTRRVKAYSALLIILLGFLAFLLVSRNDIDARLMRTVGVAYNSLPDGRISNLYNLKLINKTHQDIPVDIRLDGKNGEIQLISSDRLIKSDDYTMLQFFLIMNREEVRSWKTELKLGLYQNGKKIKSITAKFIGPEVYN